MRILGYTLIAFLFVWTTTDAQLAENQEGHLAHFYQGKSLYEQEIYPASIQQFQKFFDQFRKVHKFWFIANHIIGNSVDVGGFCRNANSRIHQLHPFVSVVY